MLFNSIEFVLFFPLVVLAYCAMPPRGRAGLLLLASYVFYGWWKIEYVGLILASTALDYGVGRALERGGSPARRRALLLASLAGNLGLLGAFKYLGLFTSLLVDLGLADRVVALLLPVGISFYTFQSLAYTIDVYRGRLPAERDPVRFALYVAFFPQLVAGPIERATHLIPQLRRLEVPDHDALARGGRLVLWGFYKKLVVADVLAGYVERFFGAPEIASGSQVLLGAGFFAIQIYCDFSGYTDIARGTARCFGIEIMKNFRRPYAAASLRDFWRRWHISLSTWFRDYVYVPLGGGRAARARVALNLLVVFTLSGLWHGAAWHFVAWGAVHGLLLVAERAVSGPAQRLRRRWLGERWPRLRHGLRVAVVLVLVLLSWILFRAESLSDALTLFARIPVDLLRDPLEGLTRTAAFFPVLFAVVMEAVEWAHERHDLTARLDRAPRALRWTVYLGLLCVILLFGSYQDQEFIYFRF
ncbi:MAG: MBOAT family O-acyltransferase [Myxococcota bacterium]